MVKQILTRDRATDGAGHKQFKPHAVASQFAHSTHTDKKERLATYNLHGELIVLQTGDVLDSVPNDINVTVGIGKLLLIINAGSDVVGDIIVSGTTVDRGTGVETASDTETITVDTLSTDNSDTDAEGNERHSFTDGYITSKWFKGAIVISTTDLTLTDVDTYQIAFQQNNDSPSFSVEAFDIKAHCTNNSAWLYAYLYTVEVTNNKVDVIRQESVEVAVADATADKDYRLRRDELGIALDGTSDGFWVELFLGPIASTYWEDIGTHVWVSRDGQGGIPVAGTDRNAIHDNIANEISAITEKTSLVDNDIFVIESSEHQGTKRRVKKSNLGGGDTLPVDDTTPIARDPVDNTKIIRFDVGLNGTGVLTSIFANSAATTNLILPDASDVIVGRLSTDTLTNKTIADDSNTVRADAVCIKVRNVSGGTLPPLTAVFMSGYNAGQDRLEVELADADVVNKMPAIGIVATEILNNANGNVITDGVFDSLDTDTPGWNVGDDLYVSATPGTLTNVRPTGSSELVQMIAKVVRVHATLGRILVQSAGRTNDIPNVIDSILRLSKGADIASANDLPLISDGNYFEVTGTTAILTIDSSSHIGTQIRLHFVGILTLTHNATDLILPGAANITTAAGDEATFVEYDTGDWRCVNYQIAADAPGAGGGGGDVSAGANMTDNTIIKGDGGAKGVQDTGIVVDDNDNMSAIETATFNAEHDNGNVSGATTITWSNGQFQKFTMTGATALTLSSPTGPGTFILKSIQDVGGTNALTFTTSVNWAGGITPTWTTAGSSTDLITLYYDGAAWWGSLAIADGS